MATSQALTAAPVAFAKYPELPHDVRLMIIDEVIRVTCQEYLKVNPSWKTAKRFLFPLASVNHEWNRVLEMHLFNHIAITPSRLSEFAEICGKRHGRLNNIMLAISMREMPDKDRPEIYLGAAIAQLFNIMKDWSRLDRERHGLLNVRLIIEDNLHHVPRGAKLTCNFGTLPQVPIIGQFSEMGFGSMLLHPSSSLRLYQSCPNSRRATLALPFVGHQNQSTQEARNAITSLASIQPDLMHLELVAQQWHPSRPTLERDAWMPAPDCVAAFPSSWINNLQKLDLQNVDDIPRFLTEAGQLAWPNLKMLSLLGMVDTQDKAKDEIMATSRETCTALVQGLIAVLPSMPHITAVLINMQCTVGYFGRIRLGMSLGSPSRVQEDFWVESCSYHFVRSSDNGVVLAIGASFPGHLATELQRTVRRQQLKDLGVFFHHNYYGLKNSGNWFCWQWDSDEGSWDAAFEEEADEFMYQMGQYLEDCPM